MPDGESRPQRGSNKTGRSVEGAVCSKGGNMRFGRGSKCKHEKGETKAAAGRASELIRMSQKSVGSEKADVVRY